MFSLFILVILSSSVNFIWTATPYKDCGSESGTIQTFDVTGCTAAPCKFVKGKTYSMNLTFQAKEPSKTASVSIHGIIGGIPIPFPLPESDACKLGVKCPVNANDANTASFSLPVLTSYPSISLYVKIEVNANDQKKDYSCLQFPATIVSSLEQERNLVRWQKGKLFEMLAQKIV